MRDKLKSLIKLNLLGLILTMIKIVEIEYLMQLQKDVKVEFPRKSCFLPESKFDNFFFFLVSRKGAFATDVSQFLVIFDPPVLPLSTNVNF